MSGTVGSGHMMHTACVCIALMSVACVVTGRGGYIECPPSTLYTPHQQTWIGAQYPDMRRAVRKDGGHFSGTLRCAAHPFILNMPPLAM